MARYLVPAPLRRGYEFHPGLGWREVIVAGIGLALGIGLMVITIALHLGYVLHAAALVIPGGVGVGAATLNILDMPLYQHGQYAYQWRHSVRRRLYDLRYPTDY